MNKAISWSLTKFSKLLSKFSKQKNFMVDKKENNLGVKELKDVSGNWLSCMDFI